LGSSNSGRDRIRPYLGMFLRLGVSDLASFRDGDSRSLRWHSGASITAYGTTSGVELRFACDGNPVRQLVNVDRLPCHFGGTRPMLRCPRCSRRCRWLHLYGARFVCRICTRARYWCQTASPDARMTHRIRRLQARLASGEDVNDYDIAWIPRRPRGMRRATYQRLVATLEAIIEKYDAHLDAGLLKVIARLAPDEFAP